MMRQVPLLVLVVGCVNPEHYTKPSPEGAGTAEPVDVESTDDSADSGADTSDTRTDTGADTADDTGADTGDTGADTGPEPSPYTGQELDPPWALPDFTITDQHNVVHGPASLQGAPTVLWFFRDTASACTNDACGYRDLQTEFDALGVRIVAVGPTTVEENADWAASLDYHYLIWADTEGVLATAYNVESDFDEGNLRHAFLLDDSGQAILRYEGAVSIGADPHAVLADCQALFGE